MKKVRAQEQAVEHVGRHMDAWNAAEEPLCLQQKAACGQDWPARSADRLLAAIRPNAGRPVTVVLEAEADRERSVYMSCRAY